MHKAKKSSAHKHNRSTAVCFLKSLTQNLAYVGIVHVGESLEDLAPLILGPHHECIHWPFNVGLVVVSSPRFPEDSCLGRSSASCWPTIIGLGFICRAIDFLGPWNSQSRNKKRERGETLRDEPCLNSPSSAISIMKIVSDEWRDANPLFNRVYRVEYGV